MEGSLFDRLPGELRNRIYEFVVTETDGILAVYIHDGGGRMVKGQASGLLRTCRQIRSEAWGLLFCFNELGIWGDEDWDLTSRGLVAWAESLGDRSILRRLKSVTLLLALQRRVLSSSDSTRKYSAGFEDWETAQTVLYDVFCQRPITAQMWSLGIWGRQMYFLFTVQFENPCHFGFRIHEHGELGVVREETLCLLLGWGPMRPYPYHSWLESSRLYAAYIDFSRVLHGRHVNAFSVQYVVT